MPKASDAAASAAAARPASPLMTTSFCAARRCRFVGRFGREKLLAVRHRALRLVKLVGVELDDAREEPSPRGLGGRRIGRERLLVQAQDVPEATALDVERLQPPARFFVAGIETDELLEQIGDLDVVGAVEKLDRAPQERRLFPARAVRRDGGHHLRELLRLPRLQEERLDHLERTRVRGRYRQRALQARHRAELVTENVAEVAGRLEQELRRHRLRNRLQPLALRHRLERKRELAHAVVASGRRMQLVPPAGRKCAAAQRREHRVEELLLVLDLRLEREGRRMLIRAFPLPRRLLLHGEPRCPGTRPGSIESNRPRSLPLRLRPAAFRSQRNASGFLA